MIRVKTAYEKRGDIMIDTLLFKYTACGFIIFERRVFYSLLPKMRNRYRKRLRKSRYRVSDPSRASFWLFSVTSSHDISICLIFCES